MVSNNAKGASFEKISQCIFNFCRWILSEESAEGEKGPGGDGWWTGTTLTLGCTSQVISPMMDSHLYSSCSNTLWVTATGRISPCWSSNKTSIWDKSSALWKFLTVECKRSNLQRQEWDIYTVTTDPPASIYHICIITTEFTFCIYKDVLLQLDAILLYLTDVLTLTRQHSCPQALDCGKRDQRVGAAPVSTLGADGGSGASPQGPWTPG